MAAAGWRAATWAALVAGVGGTATVVRAEAPWVGRVVWAAWRERAARKVVWVEKVAPTAGTMVVATAEARAGARVARVARVGWEAVRGAVGWGSEARVAREAARVAVEGVRVTGEGRAVAVRAAGAAVLVAKGVAKAGTTEVVVRADAKAASMVEVEMVVGEVGRVGRVVEKAVG